MTPRVASIDNVTSPAHPNHEIQMPKENENANKTKHTPHFHYF